MNTILSDCDGVIFDWENAFHDWMVNMGHSLVPGGENFWGIHRRYDLQRGTALDYVKTFNQSARIGYLEPHGDSIEGIKYLKDRNMKFHFVTAMGTDHYAKKLRIRNIVDVFGLEYESDFEIDFVDAADPKDEILAKLSQELPGAYWIEDNPKNADVGLAFGLKSVLIKHPHNRNYAGKAVQVDTWKEIVTLITGE